MKKIAVLISGSGSNLQAIIDNTSNGFIQGKVSVVISNKKDAYGLERAKNHHIPNYFISFKEAGTAEKYDAQILQLLEKYEIDCVVLAGYLRILTPKFIAQYENRIINIHPSLLPSFGGHGFYGEKVHEAVLEYGAKVSGATVHFVDNGTDTGPIILQDTVYVANEDTPKTLQQRILRIEHQLLPLAVKMYCENKIKITKIESKRTKVEIV